MSGAECQAWILSRRDGTRLGFTDHDEVLTVDGVSCRPRSGFTASSAQTQLGFAHDNAALEAVLEDDGIRSEDIEAGLYAAAEITTWRVDWESGAHKKTRTQRLLTIERDTAGRFTAEVVGLSSVFDTMSGEVVSRLCAAKFGDDRCGLSRNAYPDGTDCARTFAACKAFHNVPNYRGFPHLIGDDALLQGPREGRVLDGASRYGDRPDV